MSILEHVFDFKVVSNPIDLLKIQQKLKTDEYENIDALQSDVELLVNNTKAFYKVGVCILQSSVLVYCIGSLVFMRDIATYFHYCPGKRGIQHPRKQLPIVIVVLVSV